MTGVGRVDSSIGPNSSRALDLIRIAASLMVVIGHGVSFFFPQLAFAPPHAPYIQNIAVVLFFIVSGYLIAHQIDRYLRLRKSFSEFFWNRWARIYSGFVPALGVILALDVLMVSAGLPYTHLSALDGRTFFGNLLMLQDWPINVGLLPNVTSFGSGRPLWTLAIEWWIYMFVGWVILSRSPLPSLRVGYWVIALVLAIVPVWNLVNGRGNGLFLHWLVGAAGYIAVSRTTWTSQLPGPYFLAAMAAAVAATIRLLMFRWEAYEPGFAMLMALAFVLLMAGFRILDEGSGLQRSQSGLVSWFAGSSFTLYLIHYTVQEHLTVLRALYGFSDALAFLAGIVVPIVLALLIAPWTEMRYRDVARLAGALVRRRQEA